jgi:hypothetical protein
VNVDRRFYWHFAWIVLVVQFALVSWTFPLSQLTTSTPLFYIDSPFHWYEMQSATAFAALGRLAGYDPYFGAGYIGNVGFNASAKIPALLSILLSRWLGDFVIYKLYVFCCAIVAPVFVPITAKLLDLRRVAGAAATVLGLLLWWLSELRWFHTAGLVSYVFTSYLALLYGALALYYLTRSTERATPIALAAIGIFGFLDHPLFPIPTAFLVIGLAAAHWRALRLRQCVILFGILPVLILVPNLVWIWPTLHYPSFANVAPSYQAAVDPSIIWRYGLGLFSMDERGTKLNVVIWFLVAWACIAPSEPKRKRLPLAITAASICLIVFAALGAALPHVATFQPNRFSAAAYLFLCIPAGCGAAALIGNLTHRGAWRAAGYISGVLLVASAVFFLREMGRELSSRDIPHYGAIPPEVRGTGPVSRWILSWLKNDTTAQARVLFETSEARVHDNAHMAGFYALTARREFIGGPYPFLHFAGFWDGFLFGKRIGAIPPADFRNYLDLYNIGWIIVFSPESKAYLNRQPELVRTAAFGPFQTYRVEGPHSFFVSGSGVVSHAGFNDLELDWLQGTQVVLKYHYVAGLVTNPAARVEPVTLPGDPSPFIRLIEPPPRITLRLR